jgi:hypothetical protein
MNIQKILNNFSYFFRVRPVETEKSRTTFEQIQSDLEKNGVTVASEEALSSFLSDESSDVAELLNQNRLHHAAVDVVDILDPIPTIAAQMVPISRELD